MSHSKRNTSRAVFTAHERSLAKAAWSVSSAKLSRDSFLPLGACCLCLSAPATDPVACPAGDIFCRECALRNILAQKQEQRRRDKQRAAAAREAAAQRAREDAEAEAHAVREFELAQAGLGRARGGGGGGQTTVDRNNDKDTPSSSTRKRKASFSLDADELARVADADRTRARRAIEAERTAAAEDRALPSFWAPSETPGGGGGGGGGGKDKGDEKTLSSIRKDKGSATPEPGTIIIVCPAAPVDQPHAIALHTLVTVQFSTDEAAATTGTTATTICPACRKPLTNASRPLLAKPCGHVLCRSCVHQFVQPQEGMAGEGAAVFDPHAPPGTTGRVRCYVCEADLEAVPGDGDGDDDDDDGGGDAEKKKKQKHKHQHKHKHKHKNRERITPGLVALRSEGTGFSAGGAREVKKDGMAFQC